MVHALEETHRVLKSGGSLVDLRPASSNRTVELELAHARLYIGEIDSSQTFADHHVADAALQGLLDQGLLAAVHEANFQVITDLESIEDLREFAATLRRTILPDELLKRIETLIADEEEDYIIRTRREMVIARYRCCKPAGSAPDFC